MEFNFHYYLSNLTIWQILIPICIIFVIHQLVLIYRLPPGPFGVPILGYSLFIDPKAPYKTFDKLGKKYGKIFCLQMGSVRVVFLTDYKLIRSAFVKEIYAGRPPLSVTHGIMKGYGILGAEGLWWQEQRRFLTQSFRHLGAHRHSTEHSKMEERIMSEIEFCMKELEKHNDGVPFDCEKIIKHTFGNLISQLIFGHRFANDHTEFTRQLELIDEGFKQVSVMGTINFFPFLRFMPYFRGAFKNLLKNMVEHHAFLQKQINDHKHTLDVANPRDYLDLFLIEMKKENKLSTFVDKQLLHSVADCLGAGYETNKVTFLWLMLFLMTNLDVQDKIRNEIENMIGHEKKITLADVSSLPYVDAVIMETQRLANLVPLGAPHGTVKDSKLEGYFIPNGTMIVALLWSIHMSPDSWLEPEMFNPDRFLDENGRVKKMECFMPFSAGRRICPGEDLAKMEIFLLLTNIVRKYIILPCEDDSPNLEPQMGFTLTPLPYKLRLIPVKLEN